MGPVSGGGCLWLQAVGELSDQIGRLLVEAFIQTARDPVKSLRHGADVSELQTLRQFFHRNLRALRLRHPHGQFQLNRVHLAFDHHGTDELPDVVDPDEVIIQDVRSHTVEELEDADGACLAELFLVLNRGNHQVIDRLQLHEVVNLFVEGELGGKQVANEGLLGQAEHLAPGRGGRGDQWLDLSVLLVLEVVDVADSVTL